MRRFRPGLQTLFLVACLLGYTACIIVSVERYVFENYRSGVSLAVNRTQFESFLRREGRSFEEGYHLLLQTGVDILYVKADSVADFENSGRLTRVLQNELIRWKQLADGFPELLMRIDPSLLGGENHGEWLLSEHGPELEKLAEALAEIPGVKTIRLAENSNDVKRFKVTGMGPAALHQPLILPEEDFDLLARMGFRIYYDLEQPSSMTPGLQQALLRAMKRNRFHGLRLSTGIQTQTMDENTRVLLTELQAGEEGAFRGVLVLADRGNQKWDRLLPVKLRQFAAGIVEESILHRKQKQLPMTPRVLVIPPEAKSFDEFRLLCQKTVENLRKHGLHLRTAQGIGRIDGNWPLAAQCVLLLGLLCLQLAVRRRAGNLALLLFFTLSCGLALLILPWLLNAGLDTEFRILITLPWLALLSFFPLVLDRYITLPARNGLDHATIAAYHLIVAFLIPLVAAPVFFALDYDPVLLNVTMIKIPKVFWLSVVALAALMFPLFIEPLRRRLLVRLLDSPMKVMDLLRIAIAAFIFVIVFKAASQHGNRLAHNLFNVPEIWLIGAPAFWFHQQARLRRRVRESWLLGPLAVLLPAGLALELCRVPALPVTWRLIFLLQCAVLGLLVTAAIWRLRQGFARWGILPVREEGGADD